MKDVLGISIEKDVKKCTCALLRRHNAHCRKRTENCDGVSNVILTIMRWNVGHKAVSFYKTLCGFCVEDVISSY